MADWWDKYSAPAAAEQVASGNWWDKYAEPAAIPDRTGEEALSDTATRVRQGLNSVVGGIVGAPVDIVNFMTTPPHQRAINKALGIPTDDLQQPEFVRGIRQSLGVDNEIEEAGLSAKAQAQAEQFQNADGFLESGEFLLKNPSYLGTEAAAQLPQLLQLVPGTTVGTVAAQAVGAASQNAQQVEEELRKQGLSEQEISDRVAQTFGGSLALNAALPMIPGGSSVERLLAGQAGKGVMRAAATKPGRIATALGGETVTEAGQEGGDQIIQNLATGAPITQGVGQAAALGAAMGGPAGLGAGVADVALTDDPEARIRRLAEGVIGERIQTPETQAVDAGRNAARAIFAEASISNDTGAVIPDPRAIDFSQQADLETGIAPVGVAPESMGDLDQQLAGLAPAPVAQQESAPIDREALLADLAEPELIRGGSRVFYRGDVPSMRARLAEAGLSEGMRQTNEDGTDAGLYFPARMQAEVDAVLRRKPSEDSATEAPTNNATPERIAEVPIASLTLSDDVPQFKSGAREDGVVEPLGGKFDRRGTGPIQVWRRKDGRMEVISGRHRLDLARRSGETNIPAQVYDEAQGFDARQAASLDAELNIRDGQGKVKDYVQYFTQPAFDGPEGRQAADARGLLARATGKRAYSIASQGSPELIAAHSADRVTDEAAVQIAQAAPQNAPLQALGMKLVQEGKSIGIAANTMRAVRSMQGDRPQTSGDMFGFDDSAIQDAVKMAGVASRKQREIAERLAAITGASKRPEIAAKEGVDVRDPQALPARIAQLRAEKAEWDDWATDPAKVGEIRAELGMEPQQAVAEPIEEKFVDDATGKMFSRRPGAASGDMFGGATIEDTNRASPRSRMPEAADLFGGPSMQERVGAAERTRDSARNSGDGKRADTGDGGLFDGPRPEQAILRSQRKQEDDYRGLHRAPSRESGSPLSDLSNTYPDDVYGKNAAQYYGHHGGGHPMDRASVRIIQSYKNEPDAPVKIYRAVPTDAGAEINAGDWVTINKDYAKEHGESQFGDGYKIIEKSVKAKDIYTNGDSIHEWGYDPEVSSVLKSKRPDAKGIESEELTGDDAAEAERYIADLRKQQQAKLDEAADPLTEGFKALGKNPDTFRTQLLPGKTVRELAKQSGANYAGQSNEDGIAVHSVAVEQGDAGPAMAKIYDDGNDVWIDVSGLKSGGGKGDAIYNMAYSYARNNGRNFKEDPAGVSDTAMYRRPVQQLSALLKSGDADNIAPGDFLATQRPGGPNTRPIKAPANRAFDPTLRENILTTYTNALNAVPEIGEIRYDTNRAAFVDASGKPVTDADFDRLASNRRANPIREAMVRVGDPETGQRLEPAPVGGNSLKVAVLAQTLLGASPSQRPALLDGLRKIAAGSLGDSGLSRILPSKRTPDPQTETPAFKKFFEGSKVVGKDGEPLRVYHGSGDDIESFDIGKSGKNYPFAKGFAFFTNKPNNYHASASNYASVGGIKGGSPNITPVYLSMKNPLIVSADGSYSAVSKFDNNNHEIRHAVKVGDHDGVIVRYTDGSSDEAIFAAIKPEQIKSAIGNNGDFDAANPSILKSEKAPADAGVSRSEPLTRAEIDADVKRVFGTAKPLTRLINSGAVSLITKAEAIKRGLGTAESLDGVKGLHDGNQGYLITDELRPDEVAGVLLHEIGVHHTMERILGKPVFDRLQKAVESFAARGDKDVLKAQKAVPADTPAEHKAHETLAYLSEQSANHTLVERMTDGTKLFLNRLGIPMSWIKAEPAAIRKIARESLLAEARRGDGSVRYNGRDTLYQRVYHGTPHRNIEKTGFKLNKIGTGEGAQAYGWGMYFAKLRDIAEHYRTTVSSDVFRVADGELFRPDSLQHINVRVMARRGDLDGAIAKARELSASDSAVASLAASDLSALEAIKARGGIEKESGQLYHAEIPEDSDLLDWDKPLSEQPEKVRTALERAGIVNFAENIGPSPTGEIRNLGWAKNVGSLRGEEIYRRLIEREFTAEKGATTEARKGSERAASETLMAAGIPGLRYLDGNSRAGGKGSANYVIWDETLLTPEKAEITPYYSKRVDGGDKSKEIVARGNGNPFYSAMLESVAVANGLPKAGGTAQQWKGWMDGAVRRGEFKQGERDWLGVDAWLDGQAGPITRDALADFIRANEVQVEDVVLGRDVLPAGSETPLTIEQIEIIEDPEDSEFWVADSPSGNRLVGKKHYPTKEAAADFALRYFNGHINERNRERAAKAGVTPKYESYQLPGGSNYRELLLTLPDAATEADSEGRYRVEFFDETGRGRVEYATMPQVEAFRRRGNRADVLGPVVRRDDSKNFKSSHFDQPNILAHVRFNERTDADGKRVLFIEEIQSDWHQAGRKKGYAGSRPWVVHDPDTNTALSRHATQAEAEAALSDARANGGHKRLTTRMESRTDGVPDAPFKATDEWAMLAFKRMVRHAAENGFDSVAWTTGEQQAERYDLSKQVDEIVVVPAKRNGHRFVTIKPLGESASISFHVDDEGVVYDGRDLDDKRLDEVLGKEMAERIMATEGKTTFDADGLKLGGSGMRAFYDKILPSAVNKWARPFGAKVRAGRLAKFDDAKPSSAMTDAELVDTLNEPIGGHEVHAIDLTTSMRDAALAGLPLFSRRTPADAERDAATRRAVAVNTLGGPTTGGAIGWNFDAGEWEGKSGTARSARAALDDKMIAWRDVQDSIAEHLGNAVPDAQNVYRLENLMHGRVKEGIDALEEKQVVPLVKAMQEAKITPEMLEEYLYALHAKERNAQIAKINPKMPDGGSGMTNAEADAILAKPLPNGMKSIAKRAQNLVRQTRKRLLDHGIITQDQFDAMESQYQNYVPLRGKTVGENEFDSGGNGAGRGIDGRPSPVKQAFGRGAGNRAENILGEIIGDAQRSIIAAEKARVGRAVMRIVLANPNPKLWTVEPVLTERKLDSTGEVYEAVVQDWSDPSIVAVRHRGQIYKVQINHAPLAKALNLVGVDQIGAVTRAAGALNRYFSAVLTRYNPAFIPVNATRDALFGLTGLAVEHGELTAMKAALYYPKAIRAAWREARRLPPKSQADTYAREFAEDGGKTGYVSMPSVEELQRKIGNGKFGGYSPQGIGRAAQAVGDLVGAMNDSVENALRLSAYVTLREQGMAREKAASYAKELTVNFNRKGSEGSKLNAWFLFYNASMQGIKRTGDLMKHPKTWGYLGALTAAQIAAVMYAMGQEDDEGTPIWDKVPDHVKQRNIVFTWLDDEGDQKILTIPMPYGFNVFPYLAGRIADGVMHAENRPRDRAMSIAADTVSTAVQSFSPVPLDDGAMGLLPTALRIPLSIQVNRDDFGRQIRKENPFGKFDVPRASMGKPDTLELFKLAATGLNRIGGGDDRTPPPMGAFDVAPEDIEYVLEKLGGGTGKFIIDMATLGQKAAGELPVEARDVPIAKRFFTNVNEPAAQQAMFYDRRDALERNADLVRDTYEKDGPEAAIALLKATPSLSGADFRRYKSADPKTGHKKGGIVVVAGRPQLVVRRPDSVYGRYKEAEAETTEVNEAMRNAYTDAPVSLIPNRERDSRLKELADRRMAAQKAFNAVWNRDVVGGE